MVKHINKHHHIQARIAIRNDLSIEAIHGDLRVVAHQNVDASNLNIAPSLQNQMCKQAIATTHVQHPGICWKKLR